MKVTLEKKEKNNVHLEVEVDNAKVAQELERTFKKVAERVNIPGFRKGKAPRQLVEKTVGRDYVRQEALEPLVNEALTQAVTDQALDLIDRPSVDLVSYEEGQGLVFKAIVPVRPDVAFKGEYKGLKATAPAAEIKAEAVTERLDLMREQRATYETVERAIAEGDRAVVDFEGKKDGVPFEGGTATDFMMEVLPGRFIEGFVEAAVGLKAGEEKTFDVTFPEGYHAPELAGQPAQFTLKIKEVKGKVVPELNDAFAATVGDFNTVADLKAHVEKGLAEEAEDARGEIVRKQLLDQVLEIAEVEIPEVMVQREINFLLQQYAQMMQVQGLDPNQVFTAERIGEMRENMKEEADKRIRTSLTLGTIAKAEGITIDEAEVEEEIKEYAAQYRVDPAAVRNQLIQTGGWSALADEVLSNKILDFLVEKAEVADGPVPEKYQPKAEEAEA